MRLWDTLPAKAQAELRADMRRHNADTPQFEHLCARVWHLDNGRKLLRSCGLGRWFK